MYDVSNIGQRLCCSQTNVFCYHIKHRQSPYRSWWQKPGLTIYNSNSICKLAMLLCMLNVILEFCLWDGIICLFVCNQILHSIIRVTPNSTFSQSMRIPQLWRVSAWWQKIFFKKEALCPFCEAFSAALY